MWIFYLLFFIYSSEFVYTNQSWLVTILSRENITKKKSLELVIWQISTFINLNFIVQWNVCYMRHEITKR